MLASDDDDDLFLKLNFFSRSLYNLAPLFLNDERADFVPLDEQPDAASPLAAMSTLSALLFFLEDDDDFEEAGGGIGLEVLEAEVDAAVAVVVGPDDDEVVVLFWFVEFDAPAAAFSSLAAFAFCLLNVLSCSNVHFVCGSALLNMSLFSVTGSDDCVGGVGGEAVVVVLAVDVSVDLSAFRVVELVVPLDDDLLLLLLLLPLAEVVDELL